MSLIGWTGSAAAGTIGNPDFNIVSLRGNAVLRWNTCRIEPVPGMDTEQVGLRARGRIRIPAVDDSPLHGEAR